MGESSEGFDRGLATLVPATDTRTKLRWRQPPRYHVVLWDSDNHTYDYVERMLRELFGHAPAECHKLAEEVDSQGRAVVLTTTKEHAELKRDQIHAYGRDQLKGSRGSMWSTIEPVD